MNHRAKSVVRHMVKRDKGRASDFLSQPLDGVELLLQGQTCVPQDMETTEEQSRRGGRISPMTACRV